MPRLAGTRRLALLLVAALVAGNANAQLSAVPLNGDSAVYELEKYSVWSPQGRDWFELKRGRRDVFFGRKLPSPTHSFIAIAIAEPISEKLASPEEYAAFFSRLLLPARDNKRSVVIDYYVKLDSSLGRYCVRYYTKAADHGAIHAGGKTLYSETFGLGCLHPGDPFLLVDVSYTERGNPAEFSDALRSEGENFLRSLKFNSR